MCLFLCLFWSRLLVGPDSIENGNNQLSFTARRVLAYNKEFETSSCADPSHSANARARGPYAIHYKLDAVYLE